MNITLGQFKLFQGLQAQLSGITAEHLVTVEAGGPLEASAKVVGTMPDHLKALIYLRDQIANKGNEAKRALRPSLDDEAFEKAIIELRSLKAAAEKANDLFWGAFRAEFPDIADKASVGYGPNFEIYYSDESSNSQGLQSLADALRGAVLVSIG